MLVYRIEGSDGNGGPYRWEDETLTEMAQKHGRTQTDRPSFGRLMEMSMDFWNWQDDHPSGTYGPRVCGCESLDKLLWWFEYEEEPWLEHMAERDFDMCIFEVDPPKFWVGGNQVIFVRNEAREIDRVPLSELI